VRCEVLKRPTRPIRRARDDRGQALVEFALVVPILLLLVLGIVDFARAWNIYEVLTDAAREGARVIVVDNGLGYDDARTRIQEAGGRAGITIDPANILISESALASGGTATTVRIEFEHELRFIGPLMGWASLDRTLNLVSEFSMRNE
jgi:Flp pilus assembly protein TadG